MLWSGTSAAKPRLPTSWLARNRYCVAGPVGPPMVLRDGALHIAVAMEQEPMDRTFSESGCLTNPGKSHRRACSVHASPCASVHARGALQARQGFRRAPAAEFPSRSAWREEAPVFVETVAVRMQGAQVEVPGNDGVWHPAWSGDAACTIANDMLVEQAHSAQNSQ